MGIMITRWDLKLVQVHTKLEANILNQYLSQALRTETMFKILVSL
ncbi:hypothetical protein LOK49_LG05G00604 [Camellia lanceoleosa]|uniref:Uncharacterized protein n=1 Tax=Camellia lanceoleosa TaxID=1840588 RepID=A0ACC0HQM1_9ERIC|nr:hypothetical protein LOK49_LG05G00604 [Camellia lanceoleosa]